MFRTFISLCSYETHIIHLNFTYGVRPLLLLALGPLPLDDVHQLLEVVVGGLPLHSLEAVADDVLVQYAAPREAGGIH